MRCFGKFITIAILAMVLAAVVLAVTCYGPTEVTDRKKQEAEFKDLFKIVPTVAVADIRYHEKDSIFGGWTRWMSFTYDAATYDAVLKTNAYTHSKFSMAGDANTPSAPVWWPKTDPPHSVVYYLDQDDTPEREGFQFREFMWHDPSSGLVYFSKSYWD